jgi:hypothetical protein
MNIYRTCFQEWLLEETKGGEKKMRVNNIEIHHICEGARYKEAH